MNFFTIVILYLLCGVVLLISAPFILPQINKLFKKHLKMQAFTRKKPSVETNTQKQAIGAVKKEVNGVLLEDSIPSYQHFESSKKFELFKYADIDELKKNAPHNNKQVLKLSTIFPNSFRPLIIPDLEGLNISIIGIGKGVFKGKRMNVMYDCVDIDTSSIEFNTMIWHFYLHELVIEEKNNIAIISYDDIKAKKWDVSIRSTVANTINSQQITLEIQGKKYEIQSSQNESPFWVYAIISFKQNNNIDIAEKGIASLVLHSNQDDSPIALRYFLRENLVSVEGGEMQQGYKYRMCFFPFNDHRRKEVIVDEQGERTITVNDFKITKDVITKSLWYIVNERSKLQYNDEPITGVRYEDVQNFISKVNKMTGLSFRLPTENEWEYAARGGKKSKGYLFAGSNDLNEARKCPNELGILRMSGCVWQMCDGYYYEWIDGKFDGFDSYFKGRVARGGSYVSDEQACYTDGRNGKFISTIKVVGKSSEYVPCRDMKCPPHRLVFGREHYITNGKVENIGFRLVLQN